MRKTLTFVSVAPHGIADHPNTRVPVCLESEGHIHELAMPSSQEREAPHDRVCVSMRIERPSGFLTDVRDYIVRRGDRMVMTDASELVDAIRKLVTVDDIPEHKRSLETGVDIVDRQSL